MTGRKVAVITGASSGIGKAAARALLDRGWRVIGVGRDPARCAAAEAEMDHPAFTMLRGDMALLAETVRVADEIIVLTPRLDALLNNAGGVTAGLVITAEGNEATFAGNHLAPFLLTKRLLPLLQATAKGQPTGSVRIVGTSSEAHGYCPGMAWDNLNFAPDYTSGAAYCQAKLANILFTRELARRAAGDGIVASVINPGPVASNFWSHGDAAFQHRLDEIGDKAVTPEQAAATLVWLADAAEAAACNGQYFDKGIPADPAQAAQDDAAAARLWDVSEKLVAGY